MQAVGQKTGEGGGMSGISEAMQGERAVLGAMLLSPDYAVPLAIELVTSSDFGFKLHQQAFDLMRQMVNAGQPVDMTTLAVRMMDAKLLEQREIGVLAEWMTASTSPTHVREYARLVRAKARRREFLELLDDAAKKVHDGAETEEEFRAVMEHVMAGSERLQMTTMTTHRGLRSGGDALAEVATTASERYRHRGQPLGLAVGFADVDRVVNGFQKQDFVVIGARPAMGKTSMGACFAEKIALDAANRRNVPVLMITLEMSDAQIMERMILGRCKIKFSKARTGMFSDCEGAIWAAAQEVLADRAGKSAEDLKMGIFDLAVEKLQAKWERKGRMAEGATNPVTNTEVKQGGEQIQMMAEKLAAVATGMLTFYDSYGATTQELRTVVGQWVRRIGWSPESQDLCPPCVIIDYIQLIKASEKANQREKRMAIEEACAVLKGLAKRHNIVVVGLAQVGRSAADNPGSRPAMKDFKESGAIEEYADVLMSLHRDPYYKKYDKLNDDAREAWEKKAGFRNREPAREQLGEPEWDGQSWYEAQATLEILKGRNVPTVEIPVLFHGENMRFSSLTPALYSNNPDKRQKPQTPEEQDLKF
jgi:replicative DNA helicase